LKEVFPAQVQLLPSSGGVFEVVADGDLVYSKKSLGRFPEEGEVADLIRAAGRGKTSG
jgi:selenoprotein W-related protein